MTFVGVDVSKARLDVAALSATGEAQWTKFENTSLGQGELIAWLRRFPRCRVALEATGSYHYGRTVKLQSRGVCVSVLNPAQVSYFVKSQQRRNKTDKADALWLAVYAKERQPLATLPLELERQSLARELGALSKDITRLKNCLEAAASGQLHPKVIALLKRRISALEADQQALEEELVKETKQANVHALTLLTSIPGVGVRTACLLLAELGEVRRFATARKLVAFAGLTPAHFESGSRTSSSSSPTPPLKLHYKTHLSSAFYSSCFSSPHPLSSLCFLTAS